MRKFFTRTSFLQKLLFSALLFAWLIPGEIAAQPCACTNCPQFMPDNFTGEFLINVMGADNPTLGQNGQGVCGVNLNFDHEYIGDLSITLTSPAGQTVTLVGPIGLWGMTDGSSWNISFVPCADMANPDPGFSDNFNNNQPWGLGNAYSGSYYPNAGCLENFNSGPVDGTWTLTVVDGQGDDVGNFYNYEIIFCDPSGITCFSCAAEAGNLTQPDVIACQGSQSLSLDLPPSYPAPLVAPPPGDYGYTYIVSGAGGVILAYEPGPDLSAYDPGIYNVCGLSYLLAQEAEIPAPNGLLTMTQLTAQLAGGMPPFCGDISGNCVSVNISAAPPDEEEFAEVCFPACYTFHGLNYCQSGTYVRNLSTPQGCAYTATLYLTVLQPSTTNRTEFICNGNCSITPGFESQCDPGMYQETFTNFLGCDSIVNLNLQILQVVATANVQGSLDCNTPSIQISGVGSSIGGSTYFWTASDGGHIVGLNNNINVTVDEAGTYQLRVCRNGGGITCCDSVSVTVVDNSMPPAAPASITGPGTVCQGDTVVFTAAIVAAATSYAWTLPPGVTAIGAANGNSIQLVWNAALAADTICVSSVNNCGNSVRTCLPVSITPAPAPGTPQGDNTVCAGAQEAYSISAITGATGYNWTISGGSIASGQGTTNVIVDWGNAATGQICANATSACGTSQNVCLNVQITSPPAAPAVAGNPNACPSGNALYTLAELPGANTYNWTVTGGSITGGQGNDSLSVLWDANVVSGIVCANAANSCGASPDQCFTVGLSVPAPGPITTLCDSTNTNYTISFPISGGTPPYAIPGGSIANGIFTSNPIASGVSYTFQIADSNACVSSNISGVFNCACLTNAGSMSLTPLSACEGQNLNATHLGGQSLDANDVTIFVLHSGPGTTLTPPIFGQNASGIFGFTAGMTYGQTYYVSMVAGNNLNGSPDLQDPCLSVAQGQPLVFFQNPVANAGLDRDTCALTQFLSAGAGVGIGTWSVLSGPGSDTLAIVSPQNPGTAVSASGYGAFALVWTLNNNACVDADTLVLDFNPSPSVTGIVHTCDGANENYTVSFQITGGTPAYVTSGTPSGTDTGNGFVSSDIPNFGAYSYLVSDGEGCVSAPLSGSFSCNCATNAGQMDLTPLSVCEGGSIVTQHLGGQNLDANDTFAYVMHTLPGAALGQILQQNTTGIFDFQNGMAYGQTYYVSFVAGNNLNGSPDLQDPCHSISPGQPLVFFQNPVADAGADLATCGAVLNLNANAPAGGIGEWSVSIAPPGGSLDLSNPNAASTVAAATGFGAYTLSWTLAQNGCLGTDQIQLQFNETPVLDNLERTCDPANENFTVTLTLSGGTPPYSVNGQSVAGNNFVSNSLANGQAYTFNVVDANNCSMPQIVGAYSCNCATDAGTMSAQMLTVCEGQTVSATASGDETLDGNDVTAYVLHNGAGPALGFVYAQNTSGVFSFDPAQMIFGTTYYISLVAGNPMAAAPDPSDPCFSVAPGQPVVWLQNPNPNAGMDLEICGQTIDLHALNSLFAGSWSQVSGPGTGAFADVNDPGSSVNVSATGAYVFRWTETNGACTASDNVSVDFHALPQVSALDETCNGTNTEYTVSFTASSGQPPYAVSGLTGSFFGANFTSQPLPNNATYTFVLVDANFCESPSISGAENCDCATDAGTMQTTPAVFCADTPATAVWDNNASTDADDLLQFILHDGAGAAVGNTIFATSNQPSFVFGGNLQYGLTYYISAVAGNNAGGSVDLDDPCLSVTPGTPVRWKPLPTAQIEGDATICQGNQAILSFSGTGTYPLTLDYSDGTNLNSLVITGPQTVTLAVTPTATTTFSLINVADGTQPVCATPLSDAATLTVNLPVNAGNANAAAEFCVGAAPLVSLASLLDGADAGGQWSEISVQPSQGSAFNAATGSFQPNGQLPGTYTFRYALSALAPCSGDEASVSVIIHPAPNADAGSDKTLNCNTISANLGGAATSLDASYHWISDGDTLNTNRQWEVQKGGVYTLLVTSTAGCTDSDVVTVTEDHELPQADSIVARDVRCFGEQNGAITVLSVTSSHSPVLYSLNGGPFVTNTQFTGLAPGVYVITLQDANGCESETPPLLVGDAPELSIDLGADLELKLSDSAHVVLQTSIPAAQLASIEWTPLADSSAAGLPYQNFQPLRSWHLEATVTDSAGCTARDQVVIWVDRSRHLFVPNIFSPDAAENNFLAVYAGRDVAEIESFQIFDRWGDQVYARKNFQPNAPVGWDGSAKGQAASPGVFVYYVQARFIDGERVLFSGDVTLLR